MLIGHARVSTKLRDPERQRQALTFRRGVSPSVPYNWFPCRSPAVFDDRIHILRRSR